MTNEEKLNFGIHIVAGMKASAMNTDFETGMIDTLSDTEMDRTLYSKEELEKLNEKDRERVFSYVEHAKKRLHEQAMFIANIALEKLDEQNVNQVQDAVLNPPICIKTLSGWNESNLELDNYLIEPCEIDEDLFMFIGEQIPPTFSLDGHVQGLDCQFEKDGLDYYFTAKEMNSRFYFLGILPEFKCD